MGNLNVLRISKKIHEMYDSKIDLSDVKKLNYQLESRSLAALALVMKSGIDEEQSASCVTDGFHDMGLDSIYLDESQKILFVVQSKWHNDGMGSIDQEEMNTFVDGVKRVLDNELDGANNKIQGKRSEIKKALENVGYRIEAVFIHTGKFCKEEYVMRSMNKLMESTNDETGDILHFTQFSMKEVYEYLATDSTTSKITIDDVVLSNWGKIEEPYVGYYGLVPAVAVGEWFHNHGNKLFAKNLRYYKGRTDVNDGINAVLENEPENFVYYNNGIKLLCEKITRKAMTSTTNATGIFSLQGVSLINGAQTTGSIGNVFEDDPNKLMNAKVLIQMIDMSNMSEEVSKLITKLSNTQNRIENKDFASQDPTQERIKRELRFYNYTYMYKTGESVTNGDSQLSFDEAIVALACLNSEVSFSNTAKKNVGALSDDISKTPYIALFNPTTNSFELLNSVLTIREIEKELQSIKDHASGKLYTTCVHGNRLIEHIILQHVKRTEGFLTRVIDISSISDTIQEMVNSIVSVVVKELETTYVDSYPANVFKNVTKNTELVNAVEREALFD